jgi:hypothetical protein
LNKVASGPTDFTTPAASNPRIFGVFSIASFGARRLVSTGLTEIALHLDLQVAPGRGRRVDLEVQHRLGVIDRYVFVETDGFHVRIIAPSMDTFRMFTALHAAVLAAILGLTALAIGIARRGPPSPRSDGNRACGRNGLSRGLGHDLRVPAFRPLHDPPKTYPLQLCHWNALAAALLSRHALGDRSGRSCTSGDSRSRRRR